MYCELGSTIQRINFQCEDSYFGENFPETLTMLENLKKLTVNKLTKEPDVTLFNLLHAQTNISSLDLTIIPYQDFQEEDEPSYLMLVEESINQDKKYFTNLKELRLSLPFFPEKYVEFFYKLWTLQLEPIRY